MYKPFHATCNFMKHLVYLILLSFLSPFAVGQNVDANAKEIDKLTLSVIHHHMNDSFYLQLRPLPGVRFETRDYILMYNGRKWKGSFSNKCLMKEGCAIKSQKIKVQETKAAAIAQNIDIKRLLEPTVSDSVRRSGPEVLGSSRYFIIVCSKGKVRKIEYGSSFWQSDYVESVLRELEKLAENAKLTQR